MKTSRQSTKRVLWNRFELHGARERLASGEYLAQAFITLVGEKIKGAPTVVAPTNQGSSKEGEDRQK